MINEYLVHTNNTAGVLWVVNYTDATPDVTYTYDRRGRQTTMVAGGITTTRKFNDAGNLLSEAYSGGPLNGLTVTNRYDAWLRRATNGLWNGSTWLAQTRYGYDEASRLRTVAAGTNTAAYSYLADSPLVGEIGFTNGSTRRMTTSKAYDYLNRLTAISSGAGGSNVAVFNYANNAANQRTSITNLDNSRWVYQYDSLGQVISGKKYWSDGTPVAGQHFEYAFDDIGNRQSTKAGGDNSGANLRPALYLNNSLNQIASREVPSYVNMLGTASNNATVTLWGDNGSYSPTSRKGEYFRGELYANNSTGAVWLTITNVAVLNNGANPDIVTNAVGRTFLPKTTETFAYDADGNLTNDGRWSYTWDAENRITSFTRISSALSGAKVKVECQYDARWRRTQKIVSTWNGSAYTAQSTNRFVYDGWNLIAILDHQSSILYSFTWGTDASGSMQGAGGVGGLISMTVHSGPNAGTYFYCYDGNHNVVALVNAANGAIAGQWEYATFGELLRATGPLAQINPFLFSTKFYDWETGFYYYGYRYYDPDTGRWKSRDPIGEEGNSNLYSAMVNDCVSQIDPDGLKPQKPPTSIVQFTLCAAKCVIQHGIGEWVGKVMNKSVLCGEIARWCQAELKLPTPGDVVGRVNLPDDKQWRKFAACLLSCAVPIAPDVKVDVSYSGTGSILCNDARGTVDYVINITLSIKVEGHETSVEAKTLRDRCGRGVQAHVYRNCCFCN